MTADPKDLETLAEAEHSSWSNWAKWMLGEIEKEMKSKAAFSDDIQSWLLDLENLNCIQRWRRQMNTSYAKLSEREKESDRKVAREKLKAYRP